MKECPPRGVTLALVLLITASCSPDSGDRTEESGSTGIDRAVFVASANEVCSPLEDELAGVANEVFGDDIYAGEAVPFGDFANAYPEYAGNSAIIYDRYPIFQSRGIPLSFIEHAPSFIEFSIPILRSTIDSLQELTAPEDDKPLIEYFIAAFDQGIEQIEAAPLGSLLGRTDPLLRSAVLAEAYGMTACATKWPPDVVICHGCVLE